MSKRVSPAKKWILDKIEEHDKILKDMIQMIKEIKAENEQWKNTLIVDIVSGIMEEKMPPDEDEPQ